ncbi:MAG: ISAzo13 family transposase [Rhodopirellula sp.]|nr:ISAzo13 family transposase [Rhodopirellula sp.]
MTTSRLSEVYSTLIEDRMRDLFGSLSEKDRRRFAALEALRLGYGGVSYLARLFGCGRELIEHGLKELEQLAEGDPVGDRIRRPGAGRPATEHKHPEVVEQLEQTLKHRSAGDPMDDSALWTDLTPRAIAEDIGEQTGIGVSGRIVRRLLKSLGCGLRKIAKVVSGGESPDRDTQFCRIGSLIDQYLQDGQAVLSMDTKKKEFPGNLYRDGRVYCDQAARAFDHDFPSWAEGVIVPHGLYDVGRNEGWLHLGLSRDTSEFACDSLRLWLADAWHLYPQMEELLLLCDGGGSNGCRTHIFKQDLQTLVNEMGLCIRVAHFPAYCSKYNPIERRLFSHVTRACQGVLFDSLSTVVRLMSRTATQTGLSVTVRILEKLYETGRQASDTFKANMPIEFDDILPRYNYRVIPQLHD